MRPFAALLLASLAFAPAAEAAVTLPLPWKQGVRLQYRSTSVSDKTKGKLHTKVQIQDVSQVEIVEAGDQGFLQRWRSLKPEVATIGDNTETAHEARMARQLLKRFESLPLDARLDAHGNYTGLKNSEELGVAMREVMLPLMLESAGSRKELKGTDPKVLREKLEPALARMTTKTAVDNALGRQVAIYNFFTAASLTPGKVETYTDEVPSPWSADVIPTKGSFQLVTSDARTATIRWRQGIDPARGLQAAWKMVEAITGVKAGDLVAAREMPKGLELQDEATVVVARDTGIIQRLEHRRVVALGAARNETRWTLELQPARAK